MSELTLGPALIERTCNAIEAEVRRVEREAFARKAYLAQVKEMFAPTDDPSPNLSFLDGSSVFAPNALSSVRGFACALTTAKVVPADGQPPQDFELGTDGSAVRANARGRAGAGVQTGSGTAL